VRQPAPGQLEIELRTLQAGDEAFALEVFESTRERERQAIPWSEGEWASFIETQFAAQCHHYSTHFPGSEHLMIVADGRPVGRAWVWRSQQEIRLIDIAILPEHRSQGIGTHIIKDLQEEAGASGRPVRHSVELENPRARALYERLGFAPTETKGLHTLMEWRPSSQTGT